MPEPQSGQNSLTMRIGLQRSYEVRGRRRATIVVIRREQRAPPLNECHQEACVEAYAS